MKSNPATLLEKARAELDAVLIRALELQATRNAKLALGDDAAVLGNLREQIAGQQGRAADLRERIAVLREAVRGDEHQQRLKDQAVFVETVAAKLTHRDEIAAELEAALAAVAEVYQRFHRTRAEILGGWPRELIAEPNSFDLTVGFLADRIGRAVNDPAALGTATKGIAQLIWQADAAFLARLKSAKLPDLPADSEAA